VRPGAQPANTDLKTYDAGILYVSTQGNANTNVIGELHVRYRCTLKKPVLEANINQVSGVLHFSGTIPTTANNFATAALQAGGSPVMAGGITLGTNTLIFGPGMQGNYFVALSVMGSTSASASGGITSGAGIANLDLFTAAATRDDISYALSAAGGASVPAILNFTITVAASGGTVTFSPSTIVGGYGMDLWVVALPSTILTMTEDEREQLEIDELRDEVKDMRNQIQYLLSKSQFDGSSSSSSAKSAISVLEPLTPDESVGMEKSIHITKDVVMKLLGK